MAQNRFAIGQARLVQHFLANAAVDVIYHKVVGVIDTSVPLTLWVGNTLFKILEKDNQRMEWGDRDYLISVASLNVGGVLFVPDRGHWIEELFPLPLGLQQFELSAPANEPVWRWSDAQHTVYRVHTKRVKN